MNQCFGCNTCASADKPLEGFIRNLPMETSHHRVEGQSTKCGFGLQGVCCRLCSNGPCRITPKAPRGICGATADVIVARNFLRAVASGSGCYIHIVENTALNVKKTAEIFLRAVASGSGCYIHIVENTALNVKKTAEIKGEIKGEKSLARLAEIFGVQGTDKWDTAKQVAQKVLDDLYKPEYEKMELVEKMAYAPRFKKWQELVQGTDKWDTAKQVAQKVLDDLYKPEYEKMELVEKMAYAPRFKKWQELGILPGGAKSEVFHGVVKCSTNLNSDPVDMYTDCLKLGISTGLYGLTLTNLLNDVLLGEPELRMAPVGLRVIDPDYINIMITGHQHTIFVDLQERLTSKEAVEKAKAAGAKGFKLVGCTCVGQDLQLRGAHYEEVFDGHAGNNYTSEAVLATGGIDAVLSEFNCTLPVGQDLQLRGAHYEEVFDGHAGNNYTSEAVLATGGIDAVLSEFNCTLPGIEPICDELKIKQICLDSVAKKANAELKPFVFEEREKQSEEIIDEIIEAYKARRGNVPMNLMPEHGNDHTLTGVSEGSLKEFLGGNWKPLIDLIVSGDIKGIAGVVGCSNLTAGGHDVLSVELTKELIAKDILVLTAGCSSGGIEN